LIRERQKLRGVIRVLSGEGRVSAWILSLLPFALAAVLNLINPEFMSALWTTPQGLQMLSVCLVLMVLGVAWMWRLIDIRI
jgi:tight adherence protein B